MLKITQLTVNHLAEAVGLDEAPRFSWRIAADGRNFVQKKYRLRITSGGVTRYDSGWTESDRSINVPADGFEMSPATAYQAQVEVMGPDGEVSEPSAPLPFVSGLMNIPWSAKYVTAEVPPCPELSKGTCVRGSFTVRGEVKEAYLFTSGLGIYVPYLNGQRAGADLLAPGWTSYNRHALYQTNDVTSLLRQGENAIGAMLGAGWYKGLMGFLSLRNNYGDRTAFLCQLLIRYEDGREQTVISDGSWVGGDSPVTFAEIYDGEHYDARLLHKDWCMPGAAPADWHSVDIVDADFSVLESQPGCRIRRMNTLPAQRLIVTPEGDRVIDFGQVLTGWPEFKVRGSAGRTCVLKCFETLDAAGNVYTANLRSAKQELRYTCATDSEESFHPEFTFYGFRFIHLADWPEDATADDFSAWVVHSDMQRIGSFTCDLPLVNRLHENILWSQRGNFLDVPTDCPQRNERMGWTGDAQIFCRTASYLMDVYAFYRKWLKDVRADQTPEGGVSHVVPDIITGKPEAANDWLLGQGTHSAAGWADAIVICPWMLYMAYGDKQILEENYGAMRAWINFMRDHAEDYIWNYKLQFGDWVALDAEEGSYFGATPNDLTCTAYFAFSTNLFAGIAGILGRREDAAEYAALHARIVDKFQRTFFTEDGDMTAQTQTAHILALYCDLAPERHLRKTELALRRLLEAEGGHLVTGFMGTTFITTCLMHSGWIEEGYELLLKEDFPSWLYQVKAGATTIWEHWDGMRPDGSMWSPDMNSFNHYAYGSIGESLYRDVVGIRPVAYDPGFHHIDLEPKPSRRMGHASGSVNTPYGEAALRWQIEGGDVVMNVRVPANATAELVLRDAAEILEADGLQFVRRVAGTQVANFGSGDYAIRYRKLD